MEDEEQDVGRETKKTYVCVPLEDEICLDAFWAITKQVGFEEAQLIILARGENITFKFQTKNNDKN